MSYKTDFIKFMQRCGALKFGDFTLKSGRRAPYFINAGCYDDGEKLSRLGEFYADCIRDNDLECDTLVGPAYKGIPLCVSAATAMHGKYGKTLGYCFDRKEVKDHGEGGMFVGKPLRDGDRVLIIEDVMTSGKAFREIYPKIMSEAKVEIVGMVISVDRMEKGLESDRSAAQEVLDEFGVNVYSIASIEDIIKALRSGEIEGREYLPAIEAYRKNYGV